MKFSGKTFLITLLILAVVMVMGTAVMAETYTVGTSASFPPCFSVVQTAAQGEPSTCPVPAQKG